MSKRVLIAEDEALIRLDLREMLVEEGYDVVGEAGLVCSRIPREFARSCLAMRSAGEIFHSWTAFVAGITTFRTIKRTLRSSKCTT